MLLLAVGLVIGLLLMACALIGAPDLLEPVPESRTVMGHPHACWTAVDGADGYRIQVARDTHFTHPVVDDRVHAVVQWYVPLVRLSPSTYFWRVRAEADSGRWGAWSAIVRCDVIKPKLRLLVPRGASMDYLRSVGQRAAEAESAHIMFERGDHRLDPGYEQPVFQWSDASDIIVDGCGASLHLMDPSSQLADLHRCRRIWFTHYTLSHHPIPYSYGVVLQVEPGGMYFDIDILSGFDGVEYARPVNQMFLYAVNPSDPRRTHPDRPGHVYLQPEATTSLGGKRRRYVVREAAERPAAAQFRPGDRVLVVYRRWPQTWVRQCDDVTFSRIGPGHSEGSLFMGGGNSHMKFLNIRGEGPGPFPGAVGWVTGNDRQGPWIEGCSWSALSDDGPNITGNCYLIHEVLNSRTFELRTGPAWQDAIWKPGDTLVFWSPTTGLPLGTTTVIASESMSTGGYGSYQRVQVADGIHGLIPGPDMLRHTHVYNLSTQNRQLVIRRNRITAGRRFGFNIKAMSALIEHNRFSLLSSSPLYFENEPCGWEGLMSRDVVVQDNVMTDCGDSEYSVRWRRANIHFNLWRNEPIQAETPWIAHRRLLIRRNTIIDREGIGIGVDNASDVRIERNVMRDRRKRRFLHDDPKGNAAIRVFERTRRVTIERNILRDRRKGGNTVQLPTREDGEEQT